MVYEPSHSPAPGRSFLSNGRASFPVNLFARAVAPACPERTLPDGFFKISVEFARSNAANHDGTAYGVSRAFLALGAFWHGHPSQRSNRTWRFESSCQVLFLAYPRKSSSAKIPRNMRNTIPIRKLNRSCPQGILVRLLKNRYCPMPILLGRETSFSLKPKLP
jgi:hypothetical protein